MNWNHKDEWTMHGNTFLVKVSRHHQGFATSIDGGHRWAVYAYIYPKHPRFAMFNGGSFTQPAINDLPLHCGCSFLQSHIAKGDVSSIQVGADYNHLYDEEFSQCATKDDAQTVFDDAETLFKFLKGES